MISCCLDNIILEFLLFITLNAVNTLNKTLQSSKGEIKAFFHWFWYSTPWKGTKQKYFRA